MHQELTGWGHDKLGPLECLVEHLLGVGVPLLEGGNVFEGDPGLWAELVGVVPELDQCQHVPGAVAFSRVVKRGDVSGVKDGSCKSLNARLNISQIKSLRIP